MYPIKSRPEPFGHAGKPGKSTAMKRHHSAKWDNSVGGMTHLVRAIYGSSDHAQDDHGNDPLCRVVETVKVCDNLGQTIHDDTFRISYWTPEDQAALETLQEWEQSEHLARVESLIRRATSKGMTLVDYCAKYELAL